MAVYFVAVLLGCILLNVIDSAYYPFSGRRSGIEILHVFGDISDKVGTYVLYYWFLLPLPFLLIWGVYKIYPSHRQVVLPKKEIGLLSETILFIVVGGICFLGARGSIGLKPLSAFDAARYADVKLLSVTLNTPFQLLISSQQAGIAEEHYLTEKEALHYFNPIQKPFGKPSGQNVVVIIVESLGKEYVGFHNSGKGYAPFIDSLMKCSKVYSHAYANGKRSIEGVAAILAGMPSLLNDNYISSDFKENELRSIGDYLQEIGYDASFYHGGKNGTMSFTSFVAQSKCGNYFGLNEYPANIRKQDFDGNWGIYDEPYLQYWARELDKKSQPFFSSLFTLSSHHPYKMPADKEKLFADGTIPIHKAIRYADFSLKKFFDTIRYKPWYSNTLFVITADHSSQNETAYYQSLQGNFEIPLFVFDPQINTLSVDSSTVQQSDILAMVLSKTYDKPFYALSNYGTNNPGFAMQYISGMYQLVQWPYVYLFDGEKGIGFYNLLYDRLMENNILGKGNLIQQAQMDKLAKSYIQQYNWGLIHNKTYVE